jgi:ankyrin repeat protein
LDVYNEDYKCPIHYACIEGHVEVVNLLMDKVELEVKDIYECRPIHYACERGHVEIVRLLLNKVELDAKDEMGRVPIHYACREGHVEVVKLLMNRVNLEKEDNDNLRPIHYACIRSKLDIVKLLVDGLITDKVPSTLPKVKLNCLDKENKTPLELTENEEIKKYLQMKLAIINRTLFVKINENYYDILIKLI